MITQPMPRPLPAPIPEPPQKPPTPDERAARLTAALPSLALNILVPTALYFVLNRYTGNTAALAYSGAIPTAFTLAGFLRTRRISALGALSIVGFAAAVAISVLFDGSPLAFELQEPLITGTLGLALLISALIRKPLLLTALRIAARNDPALVDLLAKPGAAQRISILTTIIGATLTLHSATLTFLALTRSASTYVAISKPVGLPILAAGMAILIWYRRRA
ncbi:MAG TPA: VC0807 family protein [Actinocrinis sp.]|nr:VC0807 family protein [Actinocrinis sp.]